VFLLNFLLSSDFLKNRCLKDRLKVKFLRRCLVNLSAIQALRATTDVRVEWERWSQWEMNVLGRLEAEHMERVVKVGGN
jgi:hypothetical protein